MMVVWITKQDGSKGIVSADDGSCNSPFHVNRRSSNGAKAFNVVRESLAAVDFNSRVPLRFFVDVAVDILTRRFTIFGDRHFALLLGHVCLSPNPS
jgi:hypothetical protein